MVFSGCHHYNPKPFEKKNLIGVDNQKTNLFLLKIIDAGKDCAQLKDHLDALITGQKSVELLAVAAPLITSTAKLLFNIHMDQKAKKLEALKKRVQVTYSGHSVINSEIFKECDCAVLTRLGEDGTPGLVAVANLEKHPQEVVPKMDPSDRSNDSYDAFTIQPVYIKAYNSRALTKGQIPEKAKQKNAEKEFFMDVSIGFAVKAIGKNDIGLPSVASIGAGAVSVPKVKIGEDVEGYVCSDSVLPSDIIPYFQEKNASLSVSMSITETGNVGINFKQEQAEIAAIKEALGPAFEASIKKFIESKID